MDGARISHGGGKITDKVSRDKNFCLSGAMVGMAHRDCLETRGFPPLPMRNESREDRGEGNLRDTSPLSVGQLRVLFLAVQADPHDLNQGFGWIGFGQEIDLLFQHKILSHHIRAVTTGENDF